MRSPSGGGPCQLVPKATSYPRSAMYLGEDRRPLAKVVDEKQHHAPPADLSFSSHEKNHEPEPWLVAPPYMLLWELVAVRVETKQVERCAEALGRAVAADERAVAETVPSPAPTMYLGMDGSGVPVRPPKSRAAVASSPTVRPRPARSSWPPCGRPKGATKRVGPCATSGQSAITPRSRARPAATPTRSRPPSHNGSIARRYGAVSTPQPSASSSATAPRGSGTSPNSFPAP